MSMYAVGFAMPDANRLVLKKIDGICICNSVDIAIRKLYAAAGFKNIKDYVRSYPGQFEYCRKSDPLLFNISEKRMLYKQCGKSHYVSTLYWSYGRYSSPCEEIIRDLKDSSVRTILVPKTENLGGYQYAIRSNTRINENIIGCICSDWNGSLGKLEE